MSYGTSRLHFAVGVPEFRVRSAHLGGPMRETMEPERRSKRRYPLRLPIHLADAGLPAASGITRDMSCEGVFFYLASEFAPLSDLELRLTLPAELTSSVALHLRCMARVVRVEDGPGETVGLAAVIESYSWD